VELSVKVVSIREREYRHEAQTRHSRWSPPGCLTRVLGAHKVGSFDTQVTRFFAPARPNSHASRASALRVNFRKREPSLWVTRIRSAR
jgi:hypothetical protein